MMQMCLIICLKLSSTHYSAASNYDLKYSLKKCRGEKDIGRYSDVTAEYASLIQDPCHQVTSLFTKVQYKQIAGGQ